LKFRHRKWPRMGHLNISNTSYGKKKGRESNCQLKVGNRFDPGVCRWSATRRWKALEESYNFALELILIGGLSKKLWLLKVLGVQIGIVSGLLLGSLETKSHSDVGAAERHKVYYMGEGGGFPRVRAVVSQMSPELPVTCPSTKGAPECELTNLWLVWCRFEWVNSLSLFLVQSRSFSTPL